MNAVAKMMSHYKNLSKPVKATFWFTICSFIQKGIVLLTTPVFTRLLTEEEYGLYSVYITWSGIFSLFATLNLYASGFSNAMLKYEKERNEYTSAMVGLTCVSSIICFLLYFLCEDYLQDIVQLPGYLMLFMMSDVFFAGIFSLWAQQRRFEFDYRNLIIITLLFSILSPATGILFIHLSSNHLGARIISNSFVSAVLYGVVLIWILSKSLKVYDKKYWKYALGFAIPLIPHYLSQMVLNQADRIMISDMCGMEYAAYYSVAYNVAYVLQILIASVNTSFAPWMYQSIRDTKNQEIRNLSFKLALLFAVVVIIPILLGPEIIKILATEEYYMAKWVIPPVALSVYYSFLYNMFSCVEFYYESKLFIMIGSIAIAVINIILNAIALPVFGFVVAGYTTLICYILYSWIHFLFMKIVIKRNGMKETLFQGKQLLILSVLCTIIGLLLNVLYNGWVMRYIILALVIIGLFINRTKIIKLVKE